MEQMEEYFLIKRESIGQPTMYLGQDIKRWANPVMNEEHWRLGSNTYLKEALRVVNGLIKNSGVKVGPLHEHRDGTASFYMKDTEGNWLEMLYVPPEGIQSNV